MTQHIQYPPITTTHLVALYPQWAGTRKTFTQPLPIYTSIIPYMFLTNYLHLLWLSSLFSWVWQSSLQVFLCSASTSYSLYFIIHAFSPTCSCLFLEDSGQVILHSLRHGQYTLQKWSTPTNDLPSKYNNYYIMPTCFWHLNGCNTIINSQGRLLQTGRSRHFLQLQQH